MASDKRQSAQIQITGFIRVYRRISAANSVLPLDTGSFAHLAQNHRQRANLSIPFFHLAGQLHPNQCLRPFLDLSHRDLAKVPLGLRNGPYSSPRTFIGEDKSEAEAAESAPLLGLAENRFHDGFPHLVHRMPGRGPQFVLHSLLCRSVFRLAAKVAFCLFDRG